MAMALACEREQQEGQLEGEGECGVEIQRGECVEVAEEGNLGLEDLEEEEEEEDEEVDEGLVVEEDEEEEEEEEDEAEYELEGEEDDDEEEVFSSGRGESEEGEDKEEEVSSGVRVLFKLKDSPPSVIVQYDEDGEQVEFERHDTSDQTESDSEDEEEVEEEEDEVEAGQEYTSPAYSEDSAFAELLENVTARTGVKAIGGERSPGGESSEGLIVVNDHDSYVSIAIAFPKVEEYRVNANRSTMVKLMAQSALKMELPPCGLYLAVLLLDFYWHHDRSEGRRMDSVQLHVLAYTSLYIASNRFTTPRLARTPDEFCQWAGVAEGSVKGCMIIRQLEAFERLLRPESVSSVTCQCLWRKLNRFADRGSKFPTLHMSNFIRDLEQTEYGITYFNPGTGVVKAAHDVWRTHNMLMAKLNDPTNFEDPEGAMARVLLLASMSAGRKRGAHDLSLENAASNMNKRAKLLSLPKLRIAVS
ncbi:hypothetical protein Mapa_000725 [Marchantia paleacea]|nr:hypothetical protein Mapa_000725 [Marchantia paleacea]